MIETSRIIQTLKVSFAISRLDMQDSPARRDEVQRKKSLGSTFHDINFLLTQPIQPIYQRIDLPLPRGRVRLSQIPLSFAGRFAALGCQDFRDEFVNWLLSFKTSSRDM